MPRTTRQWAHRELDRAVGLFDNIGEHLNRVEEIYRPVHEDIAEAALGIMTLISECQELTKALRNKI